MKPADRIVVMNPKGIKKFKSLLKFLNEGDFGFYAESEDGDTYPISDKELKD